MTYSDVRRQLAAQRDLDPQDPSRPDDGPTPPPPGVKKRLQEIRDILARRTGDRQERDEEQQ